MLYFVWKAFTAFNVAGPKLPLEVIDEERKFNFFKMFCSKTTSLLLSPNFRSLVSVSVIDGESVGVGIKDNPLSARILLI